MQFHQQLWSSCYPEEMLDRESLSLDTTSMPTTRPPVSRELLRLPTDTSSPKTTSSTLGSFDPTHFVTGLASIIPLDSPNNRSIWRRDPRMAAYHNIATSAANDGIKAFLARA